MARRGLGFDFLRERESCLGGMRALFPERITLRRARWFDKRERRKRRIEKGFTTEDGMRSTEDAEKKEGRRRGGGMG